MTTGPEAITVMAQVCNQPVATVTVVARHLRDAGDEGLWPKGKRGGRGRGAAHLTATHLTNFLLALMGSDVLTEAPSIAMMLRAAAPFREPTLEPLSAPEPLGLLTLSDSTARIVAAEETSLPTFGQEIEALIRSARYNEHMRRIRLVGCTISVTRAAFPYGIIDLRKYPNGLPAGENPTLKEVFSSELDRSVFYCRPPEGASFSEIDLQPNFEISTKVNWRVISALADMALDTEERAK